MSIGVLIRPFLADAEHLLRVVLPDFVVSDHRHTDALEHRLLVPRLTHAIAIDGAGFHGGRHLRRRGHRKQRIGIDLARGVAAGRGVVAGADATRCQPVTQLVVVSGHREHHAHVEWLAGSAVLLDHRLQRSGADRVLGLTVGIQRDVLLHLFPDVVRHGDAVAVEVHREGSDHISLSAKANGRTKRLTGQHVRAVQLTVDDPVEQHLPVGLRLKGDVQAFVFKKALLVGNRQRGHVGQFDKAELEVFLLQILDRLYRGRQQTAEAQRNSQ